VSVFHKGHARDGVKSAQVTPAIIYLRQEGAVSASPNIDENEVEILRSQHVGKFLPYKGGVFGCARAGQGWVEKGIQSNNSVSFLDEFAGQRQRKKKPSSM